MAEADPYPYHPPYLNPQHFIHHPPYLDPHYNNGGKGELWLVMYELADRKHQRDMNVLIILLDEELAKLKCRRLRELEEEADSRKNREIKTQQSEMACNRARELYNRDVECYVRERGEAVVERDELQRRIDILEAQLPILQEHHNLQVSCAYSGVHLQYADENGRVVHVVD
ncbi:hypothetical protein V5O48_014365 [Marasmius crinis-equi]|uniref:Uncharacterized protein n=1 Tax=Marasmius crinis-equi TaxID=585013 RepID=A0ABR3EXH7_9AGAR